MIPASSRCLLQSSLVTAEGALLDMSGSVIGVAVARLDAIANSIPQNVNFAIQTPIVVNFLLVKGAASEFGTWSRSARCGRWSSPIPAIPAGTLRGALAFPDRQRRAS